MRGKVLRCHIALATHARGLQHPFATIPPCLVAHWWQEKHHACQYRGHISTL